jgi:hypothetical protein
MTRTPQVMQCYYVTGHADFMIIMTATDLQDYADLAIRLFARTRTSAGSNRASSSAASSLGRCFAADLRLDPIRDLGYRAGDVLPFGVPARRPLMWAALRAVNGAEDNHARESRSPRGPAGSSPNTRWYESPVRSPS